MITSRLFLHDDERITAILRRHGHQVLATFNTHERAAGRSHATLTFIKAARAAMLWRRIYLRADAAMK